MFGTPVQINRPNATYEDAITGAALQAAMSESADQIRAIRPALPQIQLFPPRFGYRQDALGIEDIIHLDDIWHRWDFTGNQSGYQGTSYPSLSGY